jgi:hypothetical protein
VCRGRLSYGHHVRRHVAGHRRVVGDERVRTDLAELVDRRQAAHDHPVADLHVATQRRVVCEHALAADAAIVRDVRVRHEKVVAADYGHALVLGRAAIQRHALANDVAVADFKSRGLAPVLLVLRRGSHRRELENAVVSADARRP